MTGEQAGVGRRRRAKDVKVVGDGWTSVAVLPGSLSDLTGQAGRRRRPPASEESRFGGRDGADPAALLDSVLKSATPVSGEWGSGKLITTKLVTALLTDDGRLLVGAVTPEEITKAAGVK